MTSTLERIRSAVEQLTDINPAIVVPEATLEGLDLDSLTMVEILFKIEDDLHGLTIPTEPRPKTVADLIALVERAA